MQCIAGSFEMSEDGDTPSRAGGGVRSVILTPPTHTMVSVTMISGTASIGSCAAVGAACHLRLMALAAAPLPSAALCREAPSCTCHPDGLVSGDAGAGWGQDLRVRGSGLQDVLVSGGAVLVCSTFPSPCVAAY